MYLCYQFVSYCIHSTIGSSTRLQNHFLSWKLILVQPYLLLQIFHEFSTICKLSDCTVSSLTQFANWISSLRIIAQEDCTLSNFTCTKTVHCTISHTRKTAKIHEFRASDWKLYRLMHETGNYTVYMHVMWNKSRCNLISIWQ